jgi:hypothetical protein
MFNSSDVRTAAAEDAAPAAAVSALVTQQAAGPSGATTLRARMHAACHALHNTTLTIVLDELPDRMRAWFDAMRYGRCPVTGECPPPGAMFEVIPEWMDVRDAAATDPVAYDAAAVAGALPPVGPAGTRRLRVLSLLVMNRCWNHVLDMRNGMQVECVSAFAVPRDNDLSAAIPFTELSVLMQHGTRVSAAAGAAAATYMHRPSCATDLRTTDLLTRVGHPGSVLSWISYAYRGPADRATVVALRCFVNYSAAARRYFAGSDEHKVAARAVDPTPQQETLRGEIFTEAVRPVVSYLKHAARCATQRECAEHPELKHLYHDAAGPAVVGLDRTTEAALQAIMEDVRDRESAERDVAEMHAAAAAISAAAQAAASEDPAVTGAAAGVARLNMQDID